MMKHSIQSSEGNYIRLLKIPMVFLMVIGLSGVSVPVLNAQSYTLQFSQMGIGGSSGGSAQFQINDIIQVAQPEVFMQTSSHFSLLHPLNKQQTLQGLNTDVSDVNWILYR